MYIGKVGIICLGVSLVVFNLFLFLFMVVSVFYL